MGNIEHNVKAKRGPTRLAHSVPSITSRIDICKHLEKIDDQMYLHEHIIAPLYLFHEQGGKVGRSPKYEASRTDENSSLHVHSYSTTGDNQ